ncbi:hypothetical protein [Clostridium cellulovorans]|uniref:Uncharacterized protein n=1 Tax=Clostridium cellulovorans (strain ATCC 35296 / DSM 3052 / OCM 3 / 743B) TaxID=573061 RepID=D9SXF8_CLOC7|nr:hypothetical protein [Clostridium cellulovorans]ADL53461.1 hypothetical protein Clocel_3791 [Clostridium cellulovorans 743B]
MDIYNFLLILLLSNLKKDLNKSSNRNIVLNLNSSSKNSQEAMETSATHFLENEFENCKNISNILNNNCGLECIIDFTKKNSIPLSKDNSALSLNINDHPYIKKALDTFINENYQGKTITIEPTSGHSITGELVSIKDTFISIKTEDGKLIFFKNDNINYYY